MGYTDLTLYRRLVRRTRPYWLHMLGIFLLGLLATPLSLLAPIPLAIAVDSVIGAESPPGLVDSLLPASAKESDLMLLAVAAVLVVVIALLTHLQEIGSTLLSTYTGEKLVLGFRTQLFRHIQRLSLSYHDSIGTSDSTYRIQYDSQAIRYIAIDGIIPFITATITLVSMLYITFRLDWQLALVALAVSPVLFFVVRIYRLRLRRQSRQLKKYESATLSVVQEVLTAVRVVKAFGQEDREQERFVRRSNEGLQARIRVSLAEGGLGLLLGLTTAIGTAMVLFIGVRNVQAGTLTLGELLLVMAYLSQLYSPLKTISRKVASLQSHLASAERALSILDEAPDVIERPDALPLSRAEGAVDFRSVSFAYDQGHPILHDISFAVPPGTRVGIAGETGAGKTTLLSLLTRFYDPTDGQILLDDVDVRDYKLADLRNQFAIVLQEPVLFSSSIAENIAYADPGASEEEIVQAAQAANAHDFIVGLPDGYQTQVGERGMRLSGGERQRIALARAFLKDAPLLIMDEPTSSIDMKTEAEIMEAMKRLMHGRTSFTIAHRLSTLENCDLLLEIDHGNLVDMRSDMSTTVDQAPALDMLEPAIDRVKAGV
ncbi:MAG TPA: ABC transporter ATP-binding protein [Anaerolineae bacterium]|nr:ABC transporter ATP-binding protein [Anaerolineae bacterium]